MNSAVCLVVLQPPASIADKRSFEHMGVAYLAAALRQENIPTTIIDQNLTGQSLSQITTEIIRLNPAVIGISCYQTAFQPLQQLVSELKAQLPDTHLTLGGVFATNSTRMILQDISELDSLILGEGESALVRLTKAILNHQNWQEIENITFTNDPHFASKKPCYEPDLDQLAPPTRDTLPLTLKKGLYPLISTSRGCYGRCTYCSIAAQGRPRRTRDPELVIEEMVRLQRAYATDYFYIIDDTFIGISQKDYRRIEDFARQLIKANTKISFSFECRANEVQPELMQLLKEAGLKQVFLGLESGYQPTLDLFRKGLRVEDNLRAVQILQQLQIKYLIGFIMFHPYTDLAEVQANLQFLLKTDRFNLLNSLKNKLVVFHNTPIAQQLTADGLAPTVWYDTHCSFVNPDIEPLYQFTRHFDAVIKPKLDQLPMILKKLNSQETRSDLNRLLRTVGSTYIQTITNYIQQPDSKILEESLDHLNQLCTTQLNHYITIYEK